MEKPRENKIVIAERRKYRELSGPVGVLARVLAVALPIYAFSYIIDLWTPLGLFIYSGSHNAIFLAIVLVLLYLLVPASKKAPRRVVPWYDYLLMAAGVGGVVYIAVVYEDLLIAGGVGITVTQQLLGLATIIVLMEAVRRTVGWAMVVVSLFFLLHAKFTYLFPGILHGPQFSLARVMNYVYLSNQGIFGMILGIAATIIVSFVTFGGFLSVSGASELFLKLALALLGHVRGGGAKVAIMASALLGTLTGSPIANVGITGSFTIPLMKRIGYSPTFAAAVEVAASTGGAIMPPVMGAVAFVMADFTGLGYAKVALAAAVPAVLYFLALYFQVDLRAAKRGLSGLPKSELPSLREAVGENWMFLLPLAILVVLLMGLRYEPTRAVYYTLAALLIIALLNKRNKLTLNRFLAGLEEAGRGMIDITPLTALAGIIVASVTLTGLGINLSSLLVELAGGSLLWLAILTATACYVLGMGVAAVASYILLAILVAPAMVQMGVPLIVAHFFIFYMGVSMFITPPYAPAAFMGASLAGSKPFATGFQAMRLAIVSYLVPFICVFHPALLLEGPAWEVAVSTVTAAVATYALAAGLEGYQLSPLNWPERLVWLAGGVLLFIPSVDLILPGIVLLGVGLGLQLLRRRSRVKSQAAVKKAGDS